MFVMNTIEDLKSWINRDIELVQKDDPKLKKDREYNRAYANGLKQALFFIEEFQRQNPDKN